MHDIDRTRSEFPGELDEFQQEQFEYNFEAEPETDGEMGAASPFSESEEMALAAELLSVSDEAELDQFLGNLFKKAWSGIRKVASGVARPLGGMLKGIVQKALPLVSGALGSAIPIPGVGTAVGTALGSAASRLFEVELEGLSGEGRGCGVAGGSGRRAGAAGGRGGVIPPGFAPGAAAKSALAAAARQYAPGLFSLLGETGAAPGPDSAALPMAPRAGHTGRWV